MKAPPNPYREPSRPQGRAIHECARVFFTKPEWEAVVEAAGGADAVGDWLHARAIEVLNGTCPTCRAPLGIIGCDSCDAELCASCVAGHDCAEGR